jgi:hypothetical protein
MHSKFLLAASMLSTIAAAGTAAQTTSFAGSYNGASTSGGSCSMSYSISGVEPSGTGPYPVFIYIVGTSETYNNAAAMAAVNDMASKGYIAATVDYAESQFGTCSVLSAKSSCMFNPNSTLSAVSQLCSRAKADCSARVHAAYAATASAARTAWTATGTTARRTGPRTPTCSGSPTSRPSESHRHSMTHA